MNELKIFIAMTCISFGLHTASLSQKPGGDIAFYQQIGGNNLGAGWSFNIDMRRKRNSNEGLGFAIGFGAWSSSEKGAFAFPMTVNYLIGDGEKGTFFELGLGVTIQDGFDFNPANGLLDFITNDEERYGSFMGHFIIGLRKQPPRTGFNFRAGLSPYLGRQYLNGDENDASRFIFIPFWPYVSFGISY